MVLTQYGGWLLGPIAKVLGIIMNALYKVMAGVGIENVALCIILFTFLINALMIPSSIKTQKFSKMSSLIQPEQAKIQEKYKNKRDEASMRKSQAETAALYEKYGVKPSSGCLPLLITMPILFAMYRVMYSIPAYIEPIKELYEVIAISVQGTSGYAATLMEYASILKMSTSKWAEVADLAENVMPSSLTTNHVIDILSRVSEVTKFNKAGEMTAVGWDTVKSAFSLSAQAVKNIAEIIRINNVGFGLSVTQTPGFSFPGIIVPILAVVSQYFQQLTMTGKQKKGDNPTMDSMNGMMKFMPLVSGFFCLSLPIGLGLYWIAGAVFRTLQQIVINGILAKKSTEEMIQENLEKARVKREKKEAKSGVSSDLAAAAKQRATMNTRTTTPAATTTEPPKSEPKKKPVDGEFKQGSLSGFAHMLDRDKEEK